MEIEILDDLRINDPETYRDDAGITHIYILDTGKKYQLVNGVWEEIEPF